MDYPPLNIEERISRGPAKPWEQRLTGIQHGHAAPSYVSCSAKWRELPDADLEAAFMAARTFLPGPAPLPQPQMVSTVACCLEAQEVALAWAVVKYAELVSA
jgi:hypothetical protein